MFSFQLMCSKSQGERHFKVHHNRGTRLASAPEGYTCNYKMDDGTLCPSHFRTKGERDAHKRKSGHVKKQPPKENSGTATKPAKKKSRK